MLTIAINSHLRKRVNVFANRNHDLDAMDLTIIRKLQTLNDAGEWDTLAESKTVKVERITDDKRIDPATGLLTADAQAGLPAYTWLMDRTGADMGIVAGSKVQKKVDDYYEAFVQASGLI